MFSMDLSGLISIASELFTNLAPIIGVIGGVTLGIGMAWFVIRAVMNTARVRR